MVPASSQYLHLHTLTSLYLLPLLPLSISQLSAFDAILLLCHCLSMWQNNLPLHHSMGWWSCMPIWFALCGVICSCHLWVLWHISFIMYALSCQSKFPHSVCVVVRSEMTPIHTYSTTHSFVESSKPRCIYAAYQSSDKWSFRSACKHIYWSPFVGHLFVWSPFFWRCFRGWLIISSDNQTEIIQKNKSSEKK